MATMDLDDFPRHLGDLIAGLDPGEQLVITKGGEPVATLTRSCPGRWPCKAGSARDTVHSMGPDFEAPLDEFREYME